MRHPADGKAWKEFDETFKSFADDPLGDRCSMDGCILLIGD